VTEPLFADWQNDAVNPTMRMLLVTGQLTGRPSVVKIEVDLVRAVNARDQPARWL
jgi:hypothetical protein